jgi:hypothetical protein
MVRAQLPRQRLLVVSAIDGCRFKSHLPRVTVSIKVRNA